MGTNELPAALLRSDFTHLIGGEAVRGSDAFEVINPATGAAFALCPSASRAERDAAVEAARRAAPGWSARSYEERRALIGELSATMSQRRSTRQRQLQAARRRLTAN